MKEWIFLLFVILTIEHGSFIYRVFSGYEAIETPLGIFGGEKIKKEGTMLKVSGYYQIRNRLNSISLELKKDSTFSFTSFNDISPYPKTTIGKWELNEDIVLLKTPDICSEISIAVHTSLWKADALKKRVFFEKEDEKDECSSYVFSPASNLFVSPPKITVYGSMFLYEKNSLKRIQLHEDQKVVLYKDMYYQ